MAGTRAGGLQAAKTNKARHGEDFYKKIGHVGGKKGTTGGFFGNSERARAAGSIGGKRSAEVKRQKKLDKQEVGV